MRINKRVRQQMGRSRCGPGSNNGRNNSNKGVKKSEAVAQVIRNQLVGKSNYEDRYDDIHGTKSKADQK